MFNTLFPKIVPFRDNVGKYGTGRHVRCMWYKAKKRMHTLVISTTFCCFFYSNTVCVKRTLPVLFGSLIMQATADSLSIVYVSEI